MIFHFCVYFPHRRKQCLLCLNPSCLPVHPSHFFSFCGACLALSKWVTPYMVSKTSSKLFSSLRHVLSFHCALGVACGNHSDSHKVDALFVEIALKLIYSRWNDQWCLLSLFKLFRLILWSLFRNDSFLLSPPSSIPLFKAVLDSSL